MIISGPCSAETEEQVMQTAIRLAKTNKVDVLRAGIWKPRTRPGNFEGVGTKGLAWLQQAKKETGFLTAVEVATSKQVEDALHFGVDILWIGARTTVNPGNFRSSKNGPKVEASSITCSVRRSTCGTTKVGAEASARVVKPNAPAAVIASASRRVKRFGEKLGMLGLPLLNVAWSEDCSEQNRFNRAERD